MVSSTWIGYSTRFESNIRAFLNLRNLTLVYLVFYLTLIEMEALTCLNAK
jgi:hypothetical protein